MPGFLFWKGKVLFIYYYFYFIFRIYQAFISEVRNIQSCIYLLYLNRKAFFINAISLFICTKIIALTLCLRRKCICMRSKLRWINVKKTYKKNFLVLEKISTVHVQSLQTKLFNWNRIWHQKFMTDSISVGQIYLRRLYMYGKKGWVQIVEVRFIFESKTS